jgi:sec-independent protein translocase protein TatA
MLNIGPQELLLILVIALIVVGPHRLPELGRSIGKGLREIRKAQDEVKRTIKVELDESPASGSPKTQARAGAASAPADGADGPETAPQVGAVGPDPTPLASEPRPASEVTEISRTLGRSLGELRRAKDEVRSSFRVDLDEPDRAPTRAKPPSTPGPAEPASAASPSDQPPER